MARRRRKYKKLKADRRQTISLSEQVVRKLLYYDPETGLLKRLDLDRIITAEHVRINGIKYQTNRLIVLFMTGEMPKGRVEYKDKDHSNKRWNNIYDSKGD